MHAVTFCNCMSTLCGRHRREWNQLMFEPRMPPVEVILVLITLFIAFIWKLHNRIQCFFIYIIPFSTNNFGNQTLIAAGLFSCGNNHKMHMTAHRYNGKRLLFFKYSNVIKCVLYRLLLFVHFPNVLLFAGRTNRCWTEQTNYSPHTQIEYWSQGNTIFVCCLAMCTYNIYIHPSRSRFHLLMCESHSNFGFWSLLFSILSTNRTWRTKNFFSLSIFNLVNRFELQGTVFWYISLKYYIYINRINRTIVKCRKRTRKSLKVRRNNLFKFNQQNAKPIINESFRSHYIHRFEAYAMWS